MNNKLLFTILLYCSIVLPSCNPAKRLAGGQYLLSGNTILIKQETNIPVPGLNAINKISAVSKINQKISTEIFDKLTDELLPLIKQKPNRKLLWVLPFHLWVYSLADKGKTRKWKSWVKRTIGEEPVVYDSVMTKKTKQQFILYLENAGYFNASISDTAVMRKNRTAVVHYFVDPGTPYTIREIKFLIKDPALASTIQEVEKKSLLKKGANFNSELLIKERERMASSLQNKGYYYFSKEYVYYGIDSSLNSHQVDINIGVNRVNEDASDSVQMPQNHQQYYLNKVIIQTDFNPKLLRDSTVKDTVFYKNLIIIHSAKQALAIKPEALYRSVYLKSGDLYQGENQELTYKHLADLGIYKFISMKFTEDKNNPLGDNRLNCLIQLTTSYKQSYSSELDGTNTGGNLGVGGTVSYKNKNSFRGAELFEMRFTGGFEAQQNTASGTTINSSKDALKVFNTIEVNPSVSLGFPKYIVPWKVKIGRNSHPKTFIDLSYDYTQRPDYTMRKADLSIKYQWNETKTKKWIVSPAQVSLVDVPKAKISKEFEDYLSKLSKSISSKYEPHFIPSSRVSFIINNQDIAQNRSFSYFRINFETAGNLFWAATKLNNVLIDNYDRRYDFPPGNEVSQYIRPDIDLKFYQIINLHNTLVYRIASGIGYAYGDTTAAKKTLPFEKSFFGGGANDMRGWNIKTLGPGTYSPGTRKFEQTGDIKIIANIEYRFDLFKFWQAAFFVDAGNIWALRKDSSRPGSEFIYLEGKFLEDFGINAGPGIRLNFSFFVLRLDWGIRIKDPAEAEGKRWVATNTRINRLLSGDWSTLQLGIGYPF